MGDYNSTCVMSQLPITGGEPCAAVLLVEVPYGRKDRATSHPDDRFAPFFPPILGTYNDYGSLENIENADDVLQRILTIEKLASRDGTPFAVATAEDALEQIERGTVHFAHDNRPPQMVTMALIKKPFYLQALDTMCSICPDLIHLDSRLQALRREVPFSAWEAGITYFTGTGLPHPLLQQLIRKGCPRLWEVAALNRAFSKLRMQWIPQSGAGSQEDCTPYHLEFYRLAAQLAEERIREMESW